MASVRHHPLDNYELDDRYRRESGRVFLTGTQALVRIPLMQRTMDHAAGLNTAGFISGYRGSPLGSYDMELWRAGRFLQESNIRFLLLDAFQCFQAIFGHMNDLKLFKFA